MTLLAELKSRLRILTGWQARVECAMSGATILAYHSVIDRLRGDGLEEYVVTQQQLDSHIRFFKQRGQILALQELVDLVGKQQPLPNPVYVLTFDDALQCQLTYAKQVLDSHQVPWTLGIPAGLVERGRSVWSYELRYLIRHCWNRSRLPTPKGIPAELASSSFQDRRKATQIIFGQLMNECSVTERLEYVERLIDLVGSKMFFPRFANDPRFRMADWTILRDAANPLLEFASHGWDHVPHQAAVDQSILQKEVFDSRDVIANRLGFSPHTFVFPHGISTSNSDVAVRKAGYRCCLTTRSARVTSNVDLMRMPRFNAEYSLPILRRHLSRGSTSDIDSQN